MSSLKIWHRAGGWNRYNTRKRIQLTRCKVLQHSSRVRSLMAEDAVTVGVVAAALFDLVSCCCCISGPSRLCKQTPSSIIRSVIIKQMMTRCAHVKGVVVGQPGRSGAAREQSGKKKRDKDEIMQFRRCCHSSQFAFFGALWRPQRSEQGKSKQSP